MVSKTLIVIPVYNGELFIKKTIESCLNQTITTEIWVVDNLSTDSTREIIAPYTKKFSNVKLIENKKNYGRVGNWNKCLDLFMESNYEYIKYVFCGDEIFEDCISESERCFAIDPEIGAIAFPYEFKHRNGKVSVSTEEKYANKLLCSKEITTLNLAGGMLLGAIICNVYSKKHIQNHRFDNDEISKAGFDILVLEKSKAFYLDKVLARFNHEAHQTFDRAHSSFVYLEFSYIKLKHLERISRTSNMFTDQECKIIEQKIIRNCIRQQLPL